MSFESFFARRSEPLMEGATEEPCVDAALDFKWIFHGLGGEEPQQVSAAVDGAVISTVLGVTGALVALGVGEVPGAGTCERFWVADQREVPEGTADAEPRVRGGTGELQLRLADGTRAWLSARHCRPWTPADGPVTPGGVAPPLHPTVPPSPLRPASPPVASPIGSPTGPPIASPVARHTTTAATSPVTSPVAAAADVEAKRLERQLKHQVLREHLKWLVASRFKSQAQLADALTCTRQWLQQYLAGKNVHGQQLLPSQRHERRSKILRRGGLPTACPLPQPSSREQQPSPSPSPRARARESELACSLVGPDVWSYLDFWSEHPRAVLCRCLHFHGSWLSTRQGQKFG